MPEFNLLETINLGSKVTNKQPFAMAMIGERRNLDRPTTEYRDEDQTLIDDVLSNSFDIISNNLLFNRLKHYELKFGLPSEEFFNKWEQGETQTSPEIHDWMVIYQSFK